MKWFAIGGILTCVTMFAGCGADTGIDATGIRVQASPTGSGASTPAAPTPTDSGSNNSSTTAAPTTTPTTSDSTPTTTNGQPSTPSQPSKATAPTQSATYTVVKIDDGAADFSQANGLNSSNDVVGTVNGLNPNGDAQAFYWDGTSQQITILPSVNSNTDIEATGINAAGSIIGLTFTSLAPGKQGNPWSPVLWQNSSSSTPPAILTDPSNLIRHINDNGLLAGQDSNNRAATWSLQNGQYVATELPLIPTTGNTDPQSHSTASFALALNNNGDIAGEQTVTDCNSLCEQHAVLYPNAAAPVDLGVLDSTGHGNSRGEALNAADEVVGYSTLSYPASACPTGDTCQPCATDSTRICSITDPWWGNQITFSHAFWYTKGGLADLGVLPAPPGYSTDNTDMLTSTANGISDSDEIIGQSDIRNLNTLQIEQRAFIYLAGQMYDLRSLIDASDPNGPYLTFQNALAINCHGNILAIGTDSRDQNIRYKTHLYLLERIGPARPNCF